MGSPAVGDQDWVDHYNRVVHSNWRFQKEHDGNTDSVIFDLMFRHVKGAASCNSFRLVDTCFFDVNRSFVRRYDTEVA